MLPGQWVLLGAQRSGYAYNRVLRLLGVETKEQLDALEAAGNLEEAVEYVKFLNVFEDDLCIENVLPGASGSLYGRPSSGTSVR